MNRIRQWLIRLIFGPAKSTPPGNGQLRESHPDWKERP